MKSTLKLIICLSLLVAFATPAQNVYHRRSAFRGGATDYATTILADSPRGYWRFGESSPSGAGSVLDETANNYDLEPFNTPTFGATGLLVGDANTAMTTSGASSEYVYILSDIGLTGYPFTFECWITTTTASDMVVMSLQDESQSNVYWQIGVDATGVAQLIRRNTTQDEANGTTNVADGNPHYLVAVFTSDSSVSLYIDGNTTPEVTDTTTIAFTVDTDSFSIGMARDSTPGQAFTGTIDEVAVYSTAFTTNQIATHYAAGS